MFHRSLERLKAMMPILIDQTLEVSRTSDALISGHLQPAARIAHELTGIPLISIHTNHFGGQQPEAFRDAAAAAINPFRRTFGLPVLTDPFHTDAHSAQLALYIMSRYLGARLRTSSRHHHVTGFLFLEEEWDDPDPDLIAFLSSGPAPVTISFSSMVHDDPKALTQLLVGALRRADMRGVILRGWSGLGCDSQSDPDVFVSGYVPHTWLFARSSLVVHAGGAGTTAAALYAGVPSVVVPHLIDQPLWGALLKDVRCAKHVIHLRSLTTDELSTAITDTIDDRLVHDAACALGEKIRAERGVDVACRLIETRLAELGVVWSDHRETSGR
jgi:Glycosyl transferases, related to UDP-glucuronosyltransferase